MKTKFIALALAAITLCMALTGCMHTDIGIKMNKDETGSISATFGIEKDFYEEIRDSGDDPFEGKTTVTYELGDETYIGYTETKEYVSYNKLSLSSMIRISTSTSAERYLSLSSHNAKNKL